MKATAPGQSALLLLDIIEALNQKHIAYAVMGAFAASYYGVIRASLDADAVISVRTLQETEGLCRNLEHQGLKIERRKWDFYDPIAAVINIQDSFENRVDLLMGIRGMTPDVFSRAENAQFMGTAIKIVGLEDFIAMKIFAGSPKDIQDVLGVLDVSHPKLNLKLLKQIASQLRGRLKKIGHSARKPATFIFQLFPGLNRQKAASAEKTMIQAKGPLG